MSSIPTNRPASNLTPPTLYQQTDSGLVLIPRVCCAPAEPAPCRGCSEVVAWDDDTVEFDPLRELPTEAPAIDHGYEPTEADWADLREMQGESAARRHLDRAEPILERARRQADFYRSWGTPEGDLFAYHMGELAERIASTRATCWQEFEGRDEVLRNG